MKKTNKESAVSPVVGVMLMLVVTIIIAAVVAAFAGGMANTTEKAPSTILDVNIYSAANVGGTMSKTFAPDFTIDHLGGDSVNTADLKITFSWTNMTGQKFSATYIGAEGPIPYEGTYGPAQVEKALYVNDMSLNSPVSVWGKAVLKTGTHMQTYANYLKQDLYDGTLIQHTGNPFMDVLFDGANPTAGPATHTGGEYAGGIAGDLPAGTQVHVTIIHTPSNKAIFDKEVIVK